MIFGFTKSPKIGSWLIRWGTSDSFFKLSEASHFLIIFPNNIVMQSVFSGTQIAWKKAALKSKVMVAEAHLNKPMTKEESDELFYKMADSVAGSDYDFKGIFFFAIFSLFRKGYQLWGGRAPDYPVHNPWGEQSKFMYMELLKPLSEYLREKKSVEIFIDDLDLTMIDPSRVLKIMRTRKDLSVKNGDLQSRGKD